MYRQAGRQAGRQTVRQAGRQTDSETDRQAGRSRQSLNSAALCMFCVEHDQVMRFIPRACSDRQCQSCLVTVPRGSEFRIS